MRKLAGWVLLLAGGWMLVAPQAPIGLPELRWMGRYTFPGEALAAVFVLSFAYYLVVPFSGRRRL